MQTASGPKQSVFEENSVAVAKVAAFITAVMTAVWALVMAFMGSEWLTHSALTSMGGSIFGWVLLHYGYIMGADIYISLAVFSVWEWRQWPCRPVRT